jgi:hypothetical protein
MRREPLPKPAVVWRAGANRRCGTLRRSRDDEGHDRLLLRLWLLMPNSRTLPAGQEVLWRAIEAAPCAAASAKAVSLYSSQSRPAGRFQWALGFAPSCSSSSKAAPAGRPPRE